MDSAHWKNIALVLTYKGEHDAALQLAQEILERTPEDYMAFNCMGIAYAGKEQHGKAQAPPGHRQDRRPGHGSVRPPARDQAVTVGRDGGVEWARCFSAPPAACG